MLDFLRPTHRPLPTSTRRRLNPRDRLWLNLSRVVLIIVILLTLAPGYWVVMASLQGGNSFFSSSLIPRQITLANYSALIQETDFILWVRNSLIVCVAVSTVSTVITALAAYAFSRLRFWGRRYGLMAMLVIQMFPITIALPAYYYILLQLRLLNTFLGLILILAGGNTAFGAWLFKGYLDSLPRDLEEAAFVDGATPLQALVYILVPLARPMLAVVYLLTFIGIYSEYILSSLVLSSQNLYTLPLGLRGFIYTEFSLHWTEFAAAAVIGSVPLLVLFMLLQRYLVSGLVRGAVRG
jgi:arabinogalactan oligomer/maltooligosaccharide transport system permease protein